MNTFGITRPLNSFGLGWRTEMVVIRWKEVVYFSLSIFRRVDFNSEL